MIYYTYIRLLSASRARRTSPTSEQMFLNVGKSKTTSTPIHAHFLCTTSHTTPDGKIMVLCKGWGGGGTLIILINYETTSGDRSGGNNVISRQLEGEMRVLHALHTLPPSLPSSLPSFRPPTASLHIIIIQRYLFI